jgi:hypothetical protein
MKRIRRSSGGGLFDTELKQTDYSPLPLIVYSTPVKKERVKRVRRDKNEDPFIKRYGNTPPLEILKDFLKNRKKYVETHYPEHDQIVLLELDLYEDVLNRIINSLK